MKLSLGRLLGCDWASEPVEIDRMVLCHLGELDEPGAAFGLMQFAQAPGFDLADALAGDAVKNPQLPSARRQ